MMEFYLCEVIITLCIWLCYQSLLSFCYYLCSMRVLSQAAAAYQIFVYLRFSIFIFNRIENTGTFRIHSNNLSTENYWIWWETEKEKDYEMTFEDMLWIHIIHAKCIIECYDLWLAMQLQWENEFYQCLPLYHMFLLAGETYLLKQMYESNESLNKRILMIIIFQMNLCCHFF